MLQNCLEFLNNVCNDFFELAKTSHWKIKAVELCSLKNNIKNFLELWICPHMVLVKVTIMTRFALNTDPIYPGIIIIVFCPRAGLSLLTQVLRLQFCPKAGLSTANSGTKVAILLGMNRCGSFLLLSAPHSLFSIWTDLKRSEKISGTQTWRWGEWIWLNGPSGFHRNSPQGLNISSIRGFEQITDPEIPITLAPHPGI